jgi:peptidoglycan/xylan/chitin deacetylase (PgdA/CDA1 family)
MRRRVFVAACQRWSLLQTATPLVSFTFDDFPRTALTEGGEILKSCGACGTYYAAMSLMGATTEVGDQFRRADLEVLLRDGHELASHTFSHISCRRLSAHGFRDDVLKGQQAIDALIGESARRSFAFPFGDLTLRARQIVARDVASSRSVWGGFNGPVFDPSLLRAHSLYGGREAFARVRDLIVDNAYRKSWLIFFTHDVASTPSRYGCTPKLLELAVNCAAQYSKIRTVASVVASATPSITKNFATEEYSPPAL